jgi:NADPH-ferrihemoprotein reductase
MLSCCVAAALCCAVLGAGDRKAAAPFPDGSGHNAHDPYWATVTEVRELHMPASDRSCVHVELDISGNTQLTYLTGGCCAWTAAAGTPLTDP